MCSSIDNGEKKEMQQSRCRRSKNFIPAINHVFSCSLFKDSVGLYAKPNTSD